MQQWRLIEDEELKLKKSMLKEHPNGLKTRHALQVEQERQRIIAEITDGVRREKEEEQRYLEEQLDSISGREALLRDVQEAASHKLALSPLAEGAAFHDAETLLAMGEAVYAHGVSANANANSEASEPASRKARRKKGANGGGGGVAPLGLGLGLGLGSPDRGELSGGGGLAVAVAERKSMMPSKSVPAVGVRALGLGLGVHSQRDPKRTRNAHDSDDEEGDEYAVARREREKNRELQREKERERDLREREMLAQPQRDRDRDRERERPERLETDADAGVDSVGAGMRLVPYRPDTPGDSKGEAALQLGLPGGRSTAVAAAVRPSTSPAPAPWLASANANGKSCVALTLTQAGGVSPHGLALGTTGSDSSANFQPLMPRMNFMEKTTNSLTRIKKFLQTGGPARFLKQNAPSSSAEHEGEDLFSSKKEYNQLRALARTKTRELEELRNAYLFMRPTEEDNTRSTVSQMRIKELNMKLVTLNTRLMEADENKKNYELYIMRMKEEDVQLSKQIDYLRHLVVEYDRLLSKMARMNARVTGQKVEIGEEIVKFSSDITDFSSFAHDQLQRYGNMLQRSAGEEQQRQRSAERDHSEEKRQKRVARLQSECDTAAEEGGKIKDQLDEWQENVAFYEKRFHKIMAATGLTRPEDIVNKFFFNDEITADLSAEIEARKKRKERLLKERQECQHALEGHKNSFVLSKWRDVDSLQTRLSDDGLRLGRRKEDADRLMQQLTFVKEGAVALLHAIDETCGRDKRFRRDKKEQIPSDPFESCLWWTAQMERRLGWIAEKVHKGGMEKRRKKKKAAAAAAAQRVLAVPGGDEPAAVVIMAR